MLGSVLGTIYIVSLFKQPSDLLC